MRKMCLFFVNYYQILLFKFVRPSKIEISKSYEIKLFEMDGYYMLCKLQLLMQCFICKPSKILFFIWYSKHKTTPVDHNVNFPLENLFLAHQKSYLVECFCDLWLGNRQVIACIVQRVNLIMTILKNVKHYRINCNYINGENLDNLFFLKLISSCFILSVKKIMIKSLK